MAALRRGVAGYANGTPDVPDAPAPAFAAFRHLLGDAIGMRGQVARDAAFSGGQPPAPAPAPAPAPEPAPAARSPLGSIGDLYTGNYGNVATNPNASAFAQYLAGAAQASMNQQRVLNLSNGPSNTEKLVKGLFGTQADWEDIKNRDATAKAFSDPLVQQHLVNTPVALERAEKDPHAFAQAAQQPEFKEALRQAVGTHTEAAANPKVTPENHHKVVGTVLGTPGLTVDQANAGIAPHKYTRDEFINVMRGVPRETVQMLFGPELSHYVTPEEALTKDYFAKLHGDYADAVEKRQALEKDPNAKASWWFGKSKLAAAQEYEDQMMQTLMAAAGAKVGVTAKPYPIPPKTD